MHGRGDPDDAAARLEACEAECAALQARNAAIIASMSWRMTASLRRLRALAATPDAVRRLRRLPVIGPRLVRAELVRRYTLWHGHPPQLDPPRSFNERVLDRMMHDRDKRLRLLNDKLRMRELVRERAGAAFVVPLLGAWDRAEAIPWDDLPLPFVLKPSHASGRVAIVAAETQRNAAFLTGLARAWLATDYFDVALEWGYRDLPRHVLAEPLLRGSDGGTPVELQVFTFSGRTHCLRVTTGFKGTGERRENWFDREGAPLPYRMRSPTGDFVLPPAQARDLAALGDRLGAGFVHLRVDLYLTDDGPKVGELTPYTRGGAAAWNPPSLDRHFGDLWAEGLARHATR
jgi:hypothetical protein